MVFRKTITCMLSCMILAGSLTGCGCQARKQAAAESVPVPEASAAAETAAAETAEKTAPAVTSAPTEAPTETPTEAPSETQTEDDFWIGETPEDTRPPVEVTVPDTTHPATDYEQYMSMSEAQQKEFYDSFETDQAFFDWLNQAREEYEKANPPIIVDGSTNIELKP